MLRNKSFLSAPYGSQLADLAYLRDTGIYVTKLQQRSLVTIKRAVTVSWSDDIVHAKAALLADIHCTKRERMMPRDRSRWCLRANRSEWLPRRRRRRRDARCDVIATSYPYLGSPLTGRTLAAYPRYWSPSVFSHLILPLSIARRSLKICTKVRIAACISRDRNAKHCRSNSGAFWLIRIQL